MSRNHSLWYDVLAHLSLTRIALQPRTTRLIPTNRMGQVMHAVTSPSNTTTYVLKGHQSHRCSVLVGTARTKSRGRALQDKTGIEHCNVWPEAEARCLCKGITELVKTTPLVRGGGGSMQDAIGERRRFRSELGRN
jgi:hypothetical protein